MKIYTTSKGYKLGIQIASSILLLLAVRFYIKDVLVQFVATAVAFTLTILVALFNFKRKVTIDKKSITSENIFSKRTLQFDQIKGYRDNGTSIILISDSGKDRYIRLPATLEKYTNLKRWSKRKFADLVNLEKRYLLDSPQYGNSAIERKKSFARAHIQILILNIITFLLLLAAFFEPFRTNAILSLMLMPWIANILAYYQKGLVKIISIYAFPTIFFIILFPAAGLPIFTILNVNFLHFSNVWLPAIIMAGMLSIWTIIATKPHKGDKGLGYENIIILAILMLAYGVGSTLHLNKVLDKSTPTYFKTVLLSKRVIESRKRGPTYHLRIAPWGPQSETKEVRVSSDFYNTINVSDSLVITYRKGMFDIPFYKVEEK